MNRLLQSWVVEQAQRRPDSVAVVMGQERLTYGELDSSANQFARLLKDMGCKPGDRVCFAIPKSPAAIIAILSILKAGCVHVPIDTASPAPRVAKVVRASDPRILLGVESTSGLLDDVHAESVPESILLGLMDDSAPNFEYWSPKFGRKDSQAFASAPLEPCRDGQDAAHILFTSGSTGDPKGVVISHANVVHFVEWAARYFGMSDSDRISGHPPLHFDLSTFDIFGAFAVGAQLHLVPPDLSPLPNKVADFIRDSELTQWFSVPSVLNYMAKFDVVRFNDFSALRRVLWCGEVFPTPALIYWMQRLPNATFTNLYGPTEATIASSYYQVPECPADPTAPIPIGTACDGEELLVLDSNLKPVPTGEVGDLYIGGVGLSSGYWRDQAKTDAAFVPYGDGGRIYRTGDLARIGEDGLVYFVGRVDTQIKSRGYRIELGEIEVALNSLKKIKECAVVSVPTDGFEMNLICCAYVVQPESKVSHSEVRQDLSALLPAYMMPARWMKFEQLAKNANGKIDRRRIQEMFATEIFPQVGAEPGSISEDKRPGAHFEMAAFSDQTVK